MSDIYVRCNYCGADDFSARFPDTRGEAGSQWEAFACTSVGYGTHARIVECNQCGLVYANPRPDQSAIQDAYEAVEDPHYAQERRAREVTFAHHLEKLESFSGPGQGRRILDVGAYIGVFLEVAEEAGWNATGLELSQWAVEYGRERGLDMVYGTLEDDLFKPCAFDAVTMWDVIEHVADPKATLCRLYEALKPGGWIVVHTMDIDSLFARLMGPRWPWLMEMHIYYFSKETLTKMLEAAGFEVVTVRPERRYLSLKYLLSRLGSISPALADAAQRTADAVGLGRAMVPLNFGDLVTAYARKPEV